MVVVDGKIGGGVMKKLIIKLYKVNIYGKISTFYKVEIFPKKLDNRKIIQHYKNVGYASCLIIKQLE
jgi:hypothetical protein